MENLTVGFIGFGLIGGSIAKALRKAHPECRIMAYSRSKEPLEAAKQDGVIDIICTKEDPFFGACDYIFMCAPVESNIAYLDFLKENMRPNCILTDVGSVKTPIHDAISAKGMDACFIGGHPMAGSEKTGYANASDLLLENSYYILTPGEGVPEERLTAFTELVKSIGGIPLTMTAHDHDYTTAVISHLPHVIAATLVNAVKKLDDPEQHMKMIAAGGFKDITRIASSSPEMWQSICQENSANIVEVIDDYIEMLQEAKAKVMEPDGTGVYDMFEESRDYRNSFGDLSAGPIKKKFAFTCDLYDEPGGIATITIMLGMRGLSIKNIGIIHNRSFAEGALEIEFYTEDAMQQAIELLRGRNYTIYVRD